MLALGGTELFDGVDAGDEAVAEFVQNFPNVAAKRAVLSSFRDAMAGLPLLVACG